MDWYVKILLKNGEYISGMATMNEYDTTDVVKKMCMENSDSFITIKSCSSDGVVAYRVGDVSSIWISAKKMR